MLNSIDTYRSAGKQAAAAMNDKDIARYDFHRRWCSRAIGLEAESNRQLARAAYDEGYAEERRARVVHALA